MTHSNKSLKENTQRPDPEDKLLKSEGSSKAVWLSYFLQVTVVSLRKLRLLSRHCSFK